jgi:nucleotide-binding universal stress UspA family protein
MKILFPVVRSSNVSAALAPLLQNMVKTFKAELHVLNVEPASDLHFRVRLKEAEEWLKKFIAEHVTKVTVHTSQVLPGDPAEEILKYVDEQGIDCIFIGTHGIRGLSTVLFGTVAKTIVGKSPVPVLIVNPFLMTEDFKKRNATYLGKMLAGVPSE